MTISYTGSYSASVYSLGLAIKKCFCWLYLSLKQYVKRFCVVFAFPNSNANCRKIASMPLLAHKGYCIVTSKFNRCYLMWQASQAAILCFEESLILFSTTNRLMNCTFHFFVCTCISQIFAISLAHGVGLLKSSTAIVSLFPFTCKFKQCTLPAALLVTNSLWKFYIVFHWLAVWLCQLLPQWGAKTMNFSRFTCILAVYFCVNNLQSNESIGYAELLDVNKTWPKCLLGNSVPKGVRL